MLVPRGRTTLAERGTKDVIISSTGDKRQVTLMVGGDMSTPLSPFVVWNQTVKGVESHGVEVARSPNHWMTPETCRRWIKRILVPAVDEARREENLALDHPAILSWDCTWQHSSPPVVDELNRHNIRVVYIPARSTSYLQIADVAMNRAVKERVKTAKRRERLKRRRDGGLAELDTSTAAAERNNLRWISQAWKLLQDSACVPNGVRHVQVDSAFDHRQANHVAVARNMEKQGVLWNKRSSRDVVAPNGVPEASASARAKWNTLEEKRAHADAEKQRASRARTYVCSHCKERGHNIRTCPDALAQVEADKTDDEDEHSDPASDCEGDQEPIIVTIRCRTWCSGG